MHHSGYDRLPLNLIVELPLRFNDRTEDTPNAPCCEWERVFPTVCGQVVRVPSRAYDVHEHESLRERRAYIALRFCKLSDAKRIDQQEFGMVALDTGSDNGIALHSDMLETWFGIAHKELLFNESSTLRSVEDGKPARLRGFRFCEYEIFAQVAGVKDNGKTRAVPVQAAGLLKLTVLEDGTPGNRSRLSNPVAGMKFLCASDFRLTIRPGICEKIPIKSPHGRFGLHEISG